MVTCMLQEMYLNFTWFLIDISLYFFISILISFVKEKNDLRGVKIPGEGWRCGSSGRAPV
jgi:hypothetical protein